MEYRQEIVQEEVIEEFEGLVEEDDNPFEE